MKKTMTLNLTETEMDALETLCDEKGISKTALIRMALRLYKSVDERLTQGQKVFIESADKSERAELIVL
ncbi:ribbon-helix-helix protein, CopG family (plasmid) [Rhizobium sp. CB3060]|uniref:ribbon-helix-helix protein, CopG family n=1 Tax=Rhizobium sp. CB3060 TaxID=3138255 RepID=UPI0021A4F69D|nr:ribbon-helix-helix protein, CopG family [Rhizobium tropici]UWU25440.1 ribbon-helix-helix protein, CopG family [Rhizobium tropici]